MSSVKWSPDFKTACNTPVHASLIRALSLLFNCYLTILRPTSAVRAVVSFLRFGTQISRTVDHVATAQLCHSPTLRRLCSTSPLVCIKFCCTHANYLHIGVRVCPISQHSCKSAPELLWERSRHHTSNELALLLENGSRVPVHSTAHAPCRWFLNEVTSDRNHLVGQMLWNFHGRE